MAPPVTVEPMTVHLDPAALEDLRDRLRRTRRPAINDDAWDRGVADSWLDELLADWRDFDTTAWQQRLNALTHLQANIDGQAVHVVVAVGKSDGVEPLPLLLANGWPSSFCEYLDLLPLLTDPGAHGGDPADAFTVVLPALPGYGFSAPPPPGGLVAARVAALWDRLMTAGLGHERYVAHGSDLGAGVVAQLTRLPSTSVVSIHLATPGLPLPPQPRTAAEQSYAETADAWTAAEGSYGHQHSTKPTTVGAALLDSPAGLAAWIGEKIVAWSSLDADGRPAFARSLLLETLTLYWVTATITSSLLPYWAFRHAPDAALAPDDRSPVAAAISNFGGETMPFAKPPRELAERYLTVTSWQEHDRGGHFPAAAEPELLARTLRDVFRPYRR